MQRKLLRAIEGPWGVFLLASVVLLFFTYRLCLFQLRTNDASPLRVFGTLWTSGWAANHQLNPYARYSTTWVFHIGPISSPNIVDLNLNPPICLPLFSVLARMELHHAAALWTLLSALLLIGGTTWLIIDCEIPKTHVIWLIVSGMSLTTLVLGQTYSLFFALSVIAWRLLEREEPTWAAIVLGVLAATKPNTVLWPVLLVVGGHRRIFLPFMATIGALSCAPLLIYGSGIYSEWLHALTADPHWLFPTDVSVLSYFTRMGFRWLGMALAIALLLGITMAAATSRLIVKDLSGMALCASILCSPLGWIHYVLFVSPMIATSRWTRLLGVAAFILWLPPDVLNIAFGRSRWALALSTLPFFLAILAFLFHFTRTVLPHRLHCSGTKPTGTSRSV